MSSTGKQPSPRAPKVQRAHLQADARKTLDVAVTAALCAFPLVIADDVAAVVKARAAAEARVSELEKQLAEMVDYGVKLEEKLAALGEAPDRRVVVGSLERAGSEERLRRAAEKREAFWRGRVVELSMKSGFHLYKIGWFCSATQVHHDDANLFHACAKAPDHADEHDDGEGRTWTTATHGPKGDAQ